MTVAATSMAFDDFGRAPLLYHQGAYSMVLPHTRMTKSDDSQPPSSHFQGRLSHNLYYLMTQAVRAYQSSYQPRQLSTGLRTNEARMLMVLENDARLSPSDLLREVAMPVREIEEAVANLKRRGWASDDADGVRLTAAGIEQTEALWAIAGEQQEMVFAEFSEEQIETFKTVLKQLIRPSYRSLMAPGVGGSGGWQPGASGAAGSYKQSLAVCDQIQRFDSMRRGQTDVIQEKTADAGPRCTPRADGGGEGA